MQLDLLILECSVCPIQNQTLEHWQFASILSSITVHKWFCNVHDSASRSGWCAAVSLFSCRHFPLNSTTRTVTNLTPADEHVYTSGKRFMKPCWKWMRSSASAVADSWRQRAISSTLCNPEEGDPNSDTSIIGVILGGTRGIHTAYPHFLEWWQSFCPRGSITRSRVNLRLDNYTTNRKTRAHITTIDVHA